MRLIVFLLLLSYTSPCLGQQKENTIVLQIALMPKGKVFFYYHDEFKDVKSYVVKHHPDSLASQTVLIQSNKPLMLRFARNMQQFPIYVLPGDTIQVKAHGYEANAYTFEGKRQGEHNFFTYLDQKQCGLGIPDFLGIDMTTDLALPATRFKALYEQRLTLLNSAADSLHFSPAFYNLAQNEIRNQYMYAMLQPFALQAVDPDQIPEDYTDIVSSFYSQGWLQQGEQLYASLFYANVLGYYNRFQSKQDNFTASELSTRYENSLQHFKGIERDFLLFSLIKNNIDKGHADFGQHLARFKKDCTYAPYVRYIDSLATRYSRLAFQADVIATKLTDASGKDLAWEQILQQHKGKVIYVDFWASWCGPCIQEMPHAKILQQQLAGKEVVFVNISIDAQAAKWKKSMQQLGLNTAGKLNYLMDGSSALGRFLQLPPIPKYVLIDKEGKVFALDAKRPSDKQLLDDINLLLEHN